MPANRIRSPARNVSAAQLPISPSMSVADLAMTMSAKWLRPGRLLHRHQISGYPAHRAGPVACLTGPGTQVHVPQLKEVAEGGRHHDPPVSLRRHPGDQPVFLGIAGDQAEAALGVVIGEGGQRAGAARGRFPSRHSRSPSSSGSA